LGKLELFLGQWPTHFSPILDLRTSLVLEMIAVAPRLRLGLNYMLAGQRYRAAEASCTSLNELKDIALNELHRAEEKSWLKRPSAQWFEAQRAKLNAIDVQLGTSRAELKMAEADRLVHQISFLKVDVLEQIQLTRLVGAGAPGVSRAHLKLYLWAEDREKDVFRRSRDDDDFDTAPLALSEAACSDLLICIGKAGLDLEKWRQILAGRERIHWLRLRELQREVVQSAAPQIMEALAIREQESNRPAPILPFADYERAIARQAFSAVSDL
jgi:hypothetical protein